MRTFFALLLIAALALGTTACGGPGKGELRKSQERQAEEVAKEGGVPPAIGTEEGEKAAPAETTETTPEKPKPAKDKPAKPAAEETHLEIGVLVGKNLFDTDKLTAKAGKITITMTNSEAVPHNVAVKDGDEVVEEGEYAMADGDVSEITVELEPGEYEFYCTPHEAIGMKGTLVVT